MNKKRNILFILMAIVGLATQVNAQSILSAESFDTLPFPPTGWSVKPAITPALWARGTTSTFPNCIPHSGAAMARYRSRSVIAGTKQTLITRPLDYTNRGTSAANVNFWMYRDSLFTNQDSITVWVNSSDTLDANAVKLGTITRNRLVAMPDVQTADGWYAYSFSVPTSFTGNMTTRFIFEGTSESVAAGNGANMAIDDISFEEFPMPCTGTPNVGSIVNSANLICGGSGIETLSLSVPAVGAGITYAWEQSASASGPWSSIGSAATVTTAALSATTYFMCTATCINSGLSYTTPLDSVMVSTSLPPLVMVSPATVAICPGSTGATLAASGATTYAWSPATGLNTNTGNVVIALPIVNTQYVVTGTDAVGCTGTASVTVTIGTLPNVNITALPSDTVCAGTQVIMNSLGGGPAGNGNLYAWSDGVSTRRDTIIANATTVYSVTVTNAAGCSASDTITIVANTGTVANFGFDQSGNTYSFHDSSITAATWTWSFGDGNSSISQNPVYTYSAPGTYTVTLIVTGTSCGSDTMSIVMYIYPLSISNIELQKEVTYYPNPSTDEVHIAMVNHPIQSICIKNMVGQVVYTTKPATTSKNFTLPVSGITKGIYILEINAAGKIYPVQFVKE